MKLKNKDLILFDLDGTLIDSSPDLIASLNNMLPQFGKETVADEVARLWIGNGARTLVARALCGSFDTKEVDESLVEDALEIFLRHYRENVCVRTVLYPGVEETLEKIVKERTLAIVTNKPSAFIEPILQKLGIKEYFDYWVGADSLSEQKPSPLPLLHVVRQCKSSVESSVMVGDSKNDIIAAKRAGMDSIAVRYGYAQGEDIGEYGPDLVIENFSKLAEIL